MSGANVKVPRLTPEQREQHIQRLRDAARHFESLYDCGALDSRKDGDHILAFGECLPHLLNDLTMSDVEIDALRSASPPQSAEASAADGVVGAARRFRGANALFKAALLASAKLFPGAPLNFDSGPLVDDQQEAVAGLFEALEIYDRLRQPPTQGPQTVTLTLSRPSRITMLTFGGRQSYTAPAGHVQPFSRIVEANDSYMIMQSGLNFYVLETAAVCSTPAVNNCALANGASEQYCQMCHNRCVANFGRLPNPERAPDDKETP